MHWMRQWMLGSFQQPPLAFAFGSAPHRLEEALACISFCIKIFSHNKTKAEREREREREREPKLFGDDQDWRRGARRSKVVERRRRRWKRRWERWGSTATTASFPLLHFPSPFPKKIYSDRWALRIGSAFYSYVTELF